MPVANISVNGVAGPDFVVPINTIVSLTNVNVGGEVTYNWTILDQPEGTADVLSNSAIQSPTFTPKKEGTYLLQLVVNLGLGTQSIDYVTIALIELKTGLVIPAAGETITADSIKGWAKRLNRNLVALTNMIADSGVLVAQATGTGLVGKLVLLTGISTIKAGLPGQEDVPNAQVADGTHTWARVGMCIGTPDGSAQANGGLILVRVRGLHPASLNPAGSPAVGDPIYIANTGLPATAPGTDTRVVGRAVSASGGTFRFAISEELPGLHNLRTLILPVVAPFIGSGASPSNPIAAIGAGTPTIQVGIPLRIGDTIVAVRLRVQDSATGPTKILFKLCTSADGGAVTTIATSPASAGTGAVQTISVTGLNTVLASTFYYWIFATFSTGTANSDVYQIEVDYLPV